MYIMSQGRSIKKIPRPARTLNDIKMRNARVPAMANFHAPLKESVSKILRNPTYKPSVVLNNL